MGHYNEKIVAIFLLGIRIPSIAPFLCLRNNFESVIHVRIAFISFLRYFY